MAEDAPTGFSGGITLESEDDAGTREQAPAGRESSRDRSAGGVAWWHDQPEGAPLRLLHAGAFTNAPGGGPAIALLFSGRFDPAGSDRFNDFLAIYDRQSEPVNGRWRVAASERVLYFSLPSPGTYVVRLRAGLPDAAGNRLPQSLSGPVHVP